MPMVSRPARIKISQLMAILKANFCNQLCIRYHETGSGKVNKVNKRKNQDQNPNTQAAPIFRVMSII